MNSIDPALIDWSRAQFALTAMYHWLFVPLTLGISLIIAIMETIYYKTGDEKWKKTTKFWMKLFGVNFAIGIATGIILEFEFGTNWSNYSWFVGDIFGAPLAIEGILAFFMEATFIAVMFFGWNKVSKKFHLVSTWLVMLGATISSLWILVANGWMQFPTGMRFNPDTVRNEMDNFWSLLLSPVAISKFLHAVLSSWTVGASFVIGIASWFLIKKRNRAFALDSIKIASLVGLAGILLSFVTGDSSAYTVAQKQPMKLAAMEGLYEGGYSQGIVAVGLLNPTKKYDNNEDAYIFKVKIPYLLSFFAQRNLHGYVPGINNIIEGGYETPKGKAISVQEKINSGKIAITALSDYKKAMAKGDKNAANIARNNLEKNFGNFGYGYFHSPEETVPNVAMVFYSFRIMVILGSYFLLLFIIVSFLSVKNKFENKNWLHWVCLWSIPLSYICSQSGWIVAEVGRQPWAIQDILPVRAAISNVSVGSVQTTFFIFLILFTFMLIAGINIMLKQIKTGPEN